MVAIDRGASNLCLPCSSDDAAFAAACEGVTLPSPKHRGEPSPSNASPRASTWSKLQSNCPASLAATNASARGPFDTSTGLLVPASRASVSRLRVVEDCPPTTTNDADEEEKDGEEEAGDDGEVSRTASAAAAFNVAMLSSSTGKTSNVAPLANRNVDTLVTAPIASRNTRAAAYRPLLSCCCGWEAAPPPSPPSYACCCATMIAARASRMTCPPPSMPFGSL